MVRIAVCQITPSLIWKIERLKCKTCSQKLKRKRVELICFPEGFLTGYYAEKESAFENSLEAGKTDI
jgi:predicted amidohydrolase